MKITPQYAPEYESLVWTEPRLDEETGLWLYGNVSLLQLPKFVCDENERYGEAEIEATIRIFNGEIMVCNLSTPRDRLLSCIPLRWGIPRIMVFPWGFEFHLSETLLCEPSYEAHRWRTQWDPNTDLAVSAVSPRQFPTPPAIPGVQATTDRILLI
jgi:hypothetical protein